MIYLIMAASMLAAVYFFVRFRMLRREVRRTDEQLKEIISCVEDNRILKQNGSDAELERLLETVNSMLKVLRKERSSFEKREKEFQKQIENISHDLRTPLTSMTGYLKLMDTRELGRENGECMEIVLRKAAALQRLITQFYDFSRLMADEYALKVEDVDIFRMLREMIVDSYQEFSERGLEVHLEIPEEPGLVSGDTSALERIFLNLIQNALRYGRRSFRAVAVRELNGVTIRLGNDAPGFTREDLEQMFDRFYVKDSSRSSSSTGLGLTVAKSLTEKMNGRLTASLEGEWLEFEIWVGSVGK